MRWFAQLQLLYRWHAVAASRAGSLPLERAFQRWERACSRRRRYCRSRTDSHVAVCRSFACRPPCLVILPVIRLERSSGELMLAPVQITSATRQNLWRLTFIRTLVLAAQAGSVGLAYWLELLPLPWFQLAATLGCSMLLCVFTAIRLRTSWPVTELEYAVQLACDLFIHSALLYFSGGSTNPFVSYYLVPLTIAAV